MQFEGEHLLPGQIGQFFITLAFVASLISTIAYCTASTLKNIAEKQSWISFARTVFIIQTLSVLIIFSIIFYICSHHYFEYMYAYKHASKELEPKFLLACIWEGQEGSFLLWTIWNSFIGIFIIAKSKKPLLQGWESPVMTVISFAQFFLGMMLLGIYFFGVKIGSSPFTLTRNEIEGPIFSQPNYLSFIKDGVGLNVLLRNYWMVIHPPILFLGFASTIVPFALAYAGMQTKRFADWVKPAIPFALFSAVVLGVGIMMGGKWAYESLSFGGYWAWDPVENASLVPWLVLIAGLHTMVIFTATGQSLKASYLFSILTFVFILYSTFLTRTGILGDTSVHAFTDAGAAVNVMLLIFLAAFTLPSLILLFKNYKNIPSPSQEENINTREFWMFIGSVVLFLSALFISAKTSVPVFNKIFNTKIAPPEEIEFSYNKVMVLVASIVGLLSALTQYFKYKNTSPQFFLKKIATPTLVAAMVTAALALFYPITYYKQGIGFLVALYLALVTSIYAIIANAFYIYVGLNGKLKRAGGAVAHLGFAVMIVGMLISSGNKKTISDNKVTGINIPFGKDAKGNTENSLENLTLIKTIPTSMLDYAVTYKGDSAGSEGGRVYYKLNFTKKDNSENFTLLPDVYIGKNELKSSNPSTKRYLTKDIYTYISSINPNEKKEDTAQFAVKELAEGDSAFYSKGYLILNKVVKNPNNEKYHFTPDDAALMADITLVGKDSMRYKAYPAIQIKGNAQNAVAIEWDDTAYAQNIYLKFVGVTDKHKIKLGIKESEKSLDFVTIKAYLFPYINLVWLGLVIMALGIVMSLIKRAKLTPAYATAILIFVAVGMFYMFFIAGR